MSGSLLRLAQGFCLTLFLGSLLSAAWPATAAEGDAQVAIFAGGCFWCVESDFDSVPGVLETISGYTGGTLDNPTYKQVTAGGTGHSEAVRITFDPNKVTYERLLHIFWRSVDPTDNGGQFCDRGDSYKTAIFATDDIQLRLAKASKKMLQDPKVLDKPIVTPIRAASKFYPAEDYHQDYYNKNPLRYKFYRFRCGRDNRIRDLWGEEALTGISHS
ncbi:peptide methionine sulfoxide reductase MsrA [bacterium MnTg02]|nr:peptide methionine sulfoxide reductase MsrA [bacterium MnTg02]